MPEAGQVPREKGRRIKFETVFAENRIPRKSNKLHFGFWAHYAMKRIKLTDESGWIATKSGERFQTNPFPEKCT